jgi:hypothetical protein
MILPNIFGGYSTDQLPNIVVNRDVSEADVLADIRRWSERFNQIVELYEGTFARRTTEVSGSFGGGTAGGEMQPYTEYGETEATRTAQAEWAWGAAIGRYRDRQMYTEEYLVTNNLGQINKDTIAATNRNYTTRLKMVVGAVVGNVNYVFNDSRKFPGSGRGPITVYRLFNADGRAGTLDVNGAIVQVGALQSYVPSGNAAINEAHFNLARTKLRERGYTGHVVHIISPADVDTVRGLAGVFVERPTTDRQYTRTTPAEPATTAVVTSPESIGAISNGGQGDGEVMVFPFWPAGYTFSYDRTKPPPIVIREHENARYRGFRLVQDETRMDYGEQALRNKRWEYIAGTGAENQANGVVVQATAGAYVVPTV